MYENDDKKRREEAFQRLERIRKKVPDLDYDRELAAYREEKGERKKEERIKCKYKSFTLCVCASNENASIFA